MAKNKDNKAKNKTKNKATNKASESVQNLEVSNELTSKKNK